MRDRSTITFHHQTNCVELKVYSDIIRNIRMVFKDGIAVDLEHELGTVRYWDYFGSTGSMSGYLGKAENAAGFQRGAPEPEEQPD